jgi:hypothetical protein
MLEVMDGVFSESLVNRAKRKEEVLDVMTNSERRSTFKSIGKNAKSALDRHFTICTIQPGTAHLCMMP